MYVIKSKSKTNGEILTGRNLYCFDKIEDRKSWPISLLKQVVGELVAETPRDLLATELWLRSISGKQPKLAASRVLPALAQKKMLKKRSLILRNYRTVILH